MGGCRCTYRNCTSRTDASLHFFHYPVADKIRCYQWLKNAQRYDFFNLTVAQLKNRVVCQHHFKDSMFMNDMKIKLKNKAIPTENGPNCTGDVIFGKDCQISFLDNLPIECENSCFTVPYSRRTDLSLRYIDFLTNGVTTDLDIENLSAKVITSDDVNDVKTKKEIDVISKVSSLFEENQNVIYNEDRNLFVPLPYKTKKLEKNNITLFNENHTFNNEIEDISPKIPIPGEIIKEEKTDCPTFDTKYNIISNERQGTSLGLELSEQIFEQNESRGSKQVNVSSEVLPEQLIFPADNANSLLQLSDLTDVIHQTPASSKYPQSFENNLPFDIPPNKFIYDNNKESEVEIQFLDQTLQDELKNVNRKSNYSNSRRTIEIISEEKVSGPVPIAGGRILNVTPSFILQPPKKTKTFFLTKEPSVVSDPQQNITKDTQDENKIYINDPPKNTFSDNAQEKEQEQVNIMQERNNVMQNSENRKLTLRSSKRNSKYIKVAPERVAVIEEKRKFNMKLRDIIEAGLNKLDENENKNANDQNLETVKDIGRVKVLPIEYEPKSKLDQCRLIGLEGRMKRMEDLLSYKIDQNNQKITEIQKMLRSDEKRHTAKSISTQTVWSDEAHRAYLFHEIAQYINAELKSNLYEELFLNTSQINANKNVKPQCSLIQKNVAIANVKYCNKTRKRKL